MEIIKKKKLQKIGLDYLFTIILVLFLIFVVPRIINFMLPFVIGYIISLLANPFVRFMEKRVKIIRKHGSVLIIALAIAGVVALLYFAGSALIDQFSSLAEDAPGIIESMKEEAEVISNKLTKVYNKLPEFIQKYVDKIKDSFLSAGATSSENGGFGFNYAWVSRTAKSIVDILFAIFFSIMSAYFFTADRDILSEGCKKIIPASTLKNISDVTGHIKKAVGGYFKAQFKIMLVMVAIMYITLKISGVNYSFLISLGIGILDLLPVFGTGAVLWPWALYKLLLGDYFMAAVLMILYGACQVIKQLLQPKVVGDSIGINSFMTLFLLFIGYRIGGLLGILIAIPLGLVLINLFKAGAFDTLINDTKYLIKMITDFQKENKV
ncbi:MAG: sporulation integral membrane protein YtvI [Lachnospiraceae bacterium]|nr:sporulation integral membrane protein YtvI [Lachnospiraceae bacterium]